MKSESIKELAKALSNAQAEIAPAEMDSVNPFLKNRYASLGAVIEAIRPVLKPCGLSYSQIVDSNDGKVGVTTYLMHESGEWLESYISMPLGDERGKSLAQAAGGIITYLRRYSLSAMFGVYAEEDTDAQKAEKTKAQVEKAAQAEVAPGPEMSLETAMAVKSSDGKSYGEIDTATLANMANSIAKKLNTSGAYEGTKREEMEYKLSAIRTLLASPDRPEPTQ
jgi:hypothetical protein